MGFLNKTLNLVMMLNMPNFSWNLDGFSKWKIILNGEAWCLLGRE